MNATGEPRPPLLLRPHYVLKPWGGHRIELELARTDVPMGLVGESWDIGDTDDVQSVVDGGPHDGRLLREVYGRPFPLLVKVLDAQENLSVQLHPDGQDGGPAKEEVWVALADGGRVATGDCAGTTPPRRWLDHLETRPLQAGSADGLTPPTMVHVPPGTVHAILAGSLVWEVQNPVDVTWRLDDYDRTDAQGRTRDLHIEESRDLLARGPEAGPQVAADGRRVAGRRVTVSLLPPGRAPTAGALVAFCVDGGTLHWGPAATAPREVFEVPAGRSVVLPEGPCQVESIGWVLLGATP
jgi:mannose-6-phosphate isomerase